MAFDVHRSAAQPAQWATAGKEFRGRRKKRGRLGSGDGDPSLGRFAIGVVGDALLRDDHDPVAFVVVPEREAAEKPGGRYRLAELTAEWVRGSRGAVRKERLEVAGKDGDMLFFASQCPHLAPFATLQVEHTLTGFTDRARHEKVGVLELKGLTGICHMITWEK